MRNATTILGLIAISLAIPCAGEEIVNFKSGQTLPILSHKILDGMIHVDLGDNAYVAFPESAIDSIIVAGKNVMIKPSYGIGSERRVPTTQGSYPVTGHQRPRDRKFIAEKNDRPSLVETDERTGMAIYRPMGNSPATNKRRVGVTGNMRVLGDHPVERGNGKTTYGGTTRVGNRHVIGGIGPHRSNTPQRPDMPRAVPLQLRNINNGAQPDTPPDRGDEGERKD